MPEACGADGGASEADPSPGLPLCASTDLIERGKAVTFDVRVWGQPARAFALRFDGKLVAYVNRCAHVPVEMDWQPGEFLDHDRRWIVCAIHGASYEPADGRCVGGPCGRAKLLAIRVEEREGQACWYPSTDIRPPIAARPPAAPTAVAPAPESPP